MGLTGLLWMTCAPGCRGRADAFGDPLPPHVVARLGTIRFRTRLAAWDVFFTADDKTVIVMPIISGDPWHAVLFDVATGRPIRRIEFQDDVDDFAPLLRGGTFLTVGDEHVRLIDLRTGKPYGILRVSGEPKEDLGRGGWRPWSARFLDERRILVGYPDAKLRIWDVRTGRCLSEFQARPPPAHGAGHGVAAMGRDGRLLVLGHADGRVEFIELREGRKAPGPGWKLPIFTHGGLSPDYVAFPARVLGVAVSPDGTLAATGARRRGLRLWDTRTRKPIRELKAAAGHATGVSFSPDGKMLAAAHEDGSVILWDPATGKRLRRWQPHVSAPSLRFSNGGDLLAVWGKSHYVRVYEVPSGRPTSDLPVHSGTVQYVAWLDGGETIVTVDEGGLLRRWTTDGGRLRSSLQLPVGRPFTLALSPDGRWLAYGVFESEAWRSVVKLRDLTGALPERTLACPKAETARLQQLAFQNGGRALTALFGRGYAHGVVWDVQTGKVLREDYLSSRWDYGPDRAGRFLLLSVNSLEVRDWQTGKALLALYPKEDWGNDAYCGYAVLTPDGKTIVGPVLRLEDGLCVVDAESGRMLYTIPLEPLEHIEHLGLSADGRRLVFTAECGGATRIVAWDMERRRQIGLVVVPYELEAGAVSPDGKHLAAATEDGPVLVWRVVAD